MEAVADMVAVEDEDDGYLCSASVSHGLQVMFAHLRLSGIAVRGLCLLGAERSEIGWAGVIAGQDIRLMYAETVPVGGCAYRE